MNGPRSYEEFLDRRMKDASNVPDGSSGSGDKGFGEGEATRDAAPTYDTFSANGKQLAVGKAEAFTEYMAKRSTLGVDQRAPQVQDVPPPMYAPLPAPAPPLPAPMASPTDTDFKEYFRTPWWKQTSDSIETQRKDRRTVFMHDDWVRHRSSERFLRNILSVGSSGIWGALSKELAFLTTTSVFVVVFNMLFYSYTDFGGVAHPGPLHSLDVNIGSLSLPPLPFTILMPALSLLLIFRTNTAYFRWNEARTLWGGLINNCRNVVRQTNTFFPDDDYHQALKRRLAAETGAFIKALRNFLRGPADDETLRGELSELVYAGLMSPTQADATMRASNRPMFCLSAMSATLRKANLDPMQAARIDSTISILVDLTGANERIFKSPIPLVYTRLTSRFLSIFLMLMPLALWGQLSDSWNHWATVPTTFLISFFLCGICEVGIQIEEPFSVLPLEAFCDGAVAATTEEMLNAAQSGVFDEV